MNRSCVLVICASAAVMSGAGEMRAESGDVIAPGGVQTIKPPITYTADRPQFYATARRAPEDDPARDGDLRGWAPGAGFGLKLKDGVTFDAEAHSEAWEDVGNPAGDLTVDTLSARFTWRF